MSANEDAATICSTCDKQIQLIEKCYKECENCKEVVCGGCCDRRIYEGKFISPLFFYCNTCLPRVCWGCRIALPFNLTTCNGNHAFRPICVQCSFSYRKPDGTTSYQCKACSTIASTLSTF